MSPNRAENRSNRSGSAANISRMIVRFRRLACAFSSANPCLRTLFDMSAPGSVSVRERRNVATRPGLAGLVRKIGEAPGGDGPAHPVHKGLIIGDIDLAEYHRPENFLAAHQMV